MDVRNLASSDRAACILTRHWHLHFGCTISQVFGRMSIERHQCIPMHTFSFPVTRSSTQPLPCHTPPLDTENRKEAHEFEWPECGSTRHNFDKIRHTRNHTQLLKPSCLSPPLISISLTAARRTHALQRAPSAPSILGPQMASASGLPERAVHVAVDTKIPTVTGALTRPLVPRLERRRVIRRCRRGRLHSRRSLRIAAGVGLGRGQSGRRGAARQEARAGA